MVTLFGNKNNDLSTITIEIVDHSDEVKIVVKENGIVIEDETVKVRYSNALSAANTALVDKKKAYLEKGYVNSRTLVKGLTIQDYSNFRVSLSQIQNVESTLNEVFQYNHFVYITPCTINNGTKQKETYFDFSNNKISSVILNHDNGKDMQDAIDLLYKESNLNKHYVLKGYLVFNDKSSSYELHINDLSYEGYAFEQSVLVLKMLHEKVDTLNTTVRLVVDLPLKVRNTNELLLAVCSYEAQGYNDVTITNPLWEI